MDISLKKFSIDWSYLNFSFGYTVTIIVMGSLAIFLVLRVSQKVIAKRNQLKELMLSIENLNDIFRIGTLEAELQFERLKRELESLNLSEGSSEVIDEEDSVVIQELRRKVDEINQILSQVDAETGTDSRAMGLKASKLYEIVGILSALANQFQEFYSKSLLESLRYNAEWFEGLGKQFEIYQLGYANHEKSPEITFEDIARFYDLNTSYAQRYTTTYPDEVIRLGTCAERLKEKRFDRLEPPIDIFLAQPQMVREKLLRMLFVQGDRPPTEEEFVAYGMAKQRFIDTAIAAKRKVELEQRFIELVEQWRRETYTTPNPRVIIEHPAYQEIIKMGQPVIPLILRELEQRPSLWFTALEAIIGEDPIAEEFQSNTREMRKAWLKWGQDNGYKWSRIGGKMNNGSSISVLF